MRNTLPNVIQCLALMLPLCAAADSFAKMTQSDSASVVEQAKVALVACGPEVLSQSTSQSVTELNSVSCNAGGPGYFHNDISYFRAFSLGAFPQGFSACAMRVGIESANAAGTAQPLTVRLYANSGAAFPGGTRHQVAATTISVSDQARSVIDIPLLGSIAPGAELVAEVFTPNGQAVGNSFFIGSNAAGQSAPGYVFAPACGLSGPTPLSAIGHPNAHLVLSVVGSATVAAGDLTLVSVPGLKIYGQMLLSLLFVALGLLAIRR